ncbi:Protein of unknown function (DUF3807) domain containing protein [Naviculisporaceae sp. PSN 640]
MASALLNPGFSLADFQAFHDAHFSQLATDQFLTHFLRPDHGAPNHEATRPADEPNSESWEDDGLGYYDDGVKRTLTDEQIAIFRHSELESLLRAAKEQSNNNAHKASPAADVDRNQDNSDEGQLSEDGELSPAPLAAAPSKKKKKKNNRRKGASYRNAAGELIDLRKRTWDVVEKGLTTLTYDDEIDVPSQSNTAKRQRISYDD